jgi:hypothetical protein
MPAMEQYYVLPSKLCLGLDIVSKSLPFYFLVGNWLLSQFQVYALETILSLLPKECIIHPLASFLFKYIISLQVFLFKEARCLR